MLIVVVGVGIPAVPAVGRSVAELAARLEQVLDISFAS